MTHPGCGCINRYVGWELTYLSTKVDAEKTKKFLNVHICRQNNISKQQAFPDCLKNVPRPLNEAKDLRPATFLLPVPGNLKPDHIPLPNVLEPGQQQSYTKWQREMNF